MRTIGITLLVVVFLLLSCETDIYASRDIKFVEKIEFSKGADLPSVPWSFCVLDDSGLFLFPGYKEGQVMLYEKDYGKDFDGRKYLQLVEKFGLSSRQLEETIYKIIS